MSGFASSQFHSPQFGTSPSPGKHRSQPGELWQLLLNLGFWLAICLIAVVIGAASSYS